MVAFTLANLMCFFLGHGGQLRVIILRKNRVEKPLQNTNQHPTIPKQLDRHDTPQNTTMTRRRKTSLSPLTRQGS